MNAFHLQATALLLLSGPAIAVAFGTPLVPPGGGEDAALEGHATSTRPPSVLDKIPGDFKNLSDEEWAKRLTPLAFKVCRKAGTEYPNTGKYNSFYAPGMYICVCCGSELFSSDSKFNSGTGWPSFHSAVSNALEEKHDESHGMIRTEVRCAKCDAHLGHVFKDGPPPTGDRFCINSCCITFVSRDKETD